MMTGGGWLCEFKLAALSTAADFEIKSGLAESKPSILYTYKNWKPQ